MNVIEEIHSKLPSTHLVMHGSSSVPQDLQDIINEFGGKMPQTYGVPVEEIQRGIKHGVRKINIDTDNRMAITGQIRRVLTAAPGGVRSAQISEARAGGDGQARQAALPGIRHGGPGLEDQAGAAPRRRWPSATRAGNSIRSLVDGASARPASGARPGASPRLILPAALPTVFARGATEAGRADLARLRQQRGGDLRPFLLERRARHRFASAAIPIGGVAGVALLAMQIGVHPVALAALVGLRQFMRAVPVALARPARAPATRGSDLRGERVRRARRGIRLR